FPTTPPRRSSPSRTRSTSSRRTLPERPIYHRRSGNDASRERSRSPYARIGRSESEMRRVVVTGLGLVTPLGTGAEHCWKRLLASESGNRGIQSFDVTDLPAKIEGQVPDGETAEGGWNPDEWMDPREQRRVDQFILYGLAAATQAVEDSGWK